MEPHVHCRNAVGGHPLLSLWNPFRRFAITFACARVCLSIVLFTRPDNHIYFIAVECFVSLSVSPNRPQAIKGQALCISLFICRTQHSVGTCVANWRGWGCAHWCELGKRQRQGMEGKIRRGIFNWSISSPCWLKFSRDIWDLYRSCQKGQSWSEQLSRTLR